MRPETTELTISLISHVCKILEHIIFSQIINHLKANQILSDKQQHGFRKKNFCESQLLLTIHDLAKGLDEKQQIDAILLDFEKAFDKVPHERLLLKLDFYGIRGNLLLWIRELLTGRHQQVVLALHQIRSQLHQVFPKGLSLDLYSSWSSSMTSRTMCHLMSVCLLMTAFSTDASTLLKIPISYNRISTV